MTEYLHFEDIKFICALEGSERLAEDAVWSRFLASMKLGNIERAKSLCSFGSIQPLIKELTN